MASFNPEATMTRAQFGTVLSRLLYGNVHNSAGSGPRYQEHLKSLRATGIMKDISKPNREEIR